MDDTKMSSPPKKLTTQYKEKKLIDSIYKLFNNGQSKKAYQQAHYLLKKVKSDRAKANVNLLLAYYFKNRSLIDSSMYYVNESLKFNKINNDSLQTRSRILAYNVRAINYKNKGLFEESKKWHLKGIQECNKFSEEDLYYTHTHGLALSYSEMGDHNRALELFKKCLEYEGDPEIIYGSYINIGIIYASIEDYESSNEYFKKGLELSQKKKNYQALAIIKLNLASNAQNQENLPEALSLYEETAEISDKHELNRIGLIARMNVGSVLIDAGNYKDAELIYSVALHDAIELGLLNQQLNIYENLKEISIQQDNYKNALNFLSKYFKVKDSISKLQKIEEINELEVKYEMLQKEKEIKILQVENKNRRLELINQEEAIKNLMLQQEVEKKETESALLEIKSAKERMQKENIILKKDDEIQQAKLSRQKSIKNTILYSFLILLIPVIGLLITYYQKLQAQSELNKKQKEISKQKITSLLKDQELKVIKASIEGQDKERQRIAQELHDAIGGNLAAIKLQLNNGNIIENGQPLTTINTQIDDTYEQVRNLSHNLIPKKFSRNNFSDVLEEYFNNIAEASELYTSFVVYPRKEIDEIDEKLQVELFKIIQELITNTIKHARATSIELQINFIENELSIMFEDNGVGFDTKRIVDGIGFENIKNRLTKISGILNIDSRIKRGTLIHIQIPTLINHTNEV
ncbi:tetratricopeptide repeat protein [Aquimarina sp. 2201CG5-10]|uniref:tetratricopeptide repeat-containing sensor histidine kinase n=1 Tax=Aquimarina callyspongiae TaxID=3098150 RepID=UPI002AB34B97|nr:tetratricopeptide repeat protein [Aquimarina sp. 2201CG5-10]MDY8138525.1 histidine kinase [Aquimarina sp. 2201CG5-10]